MVLVGPRQVGKTTLARSFVPPGSASYFDLEPSMRTAMHDLRLEALYVVYPGERRYRLAESIEAVPLKETAGERGPARARRAGV